jgi:hypothetical protein
VADAEPTPSSGTQIERLIEQAMARLEAERKAEAKQAAAAAAIKETGSRRVSIAALLLTMMLSFLDSRRGSAPPPWPISSPRVRAQGPPARR